MNRALSLHGSGPAFYRTGFDQGICRPAASGQKLFARVGRAGASQVGSPVTARRISDFLKSQQRKTSPKVILDYLGHLQEACFVEKVPRYDIRGRRLFEVNDKFYFGDLGLRNAVVGYRPGDIGQQLENTVYHHLRARGHQVRVGSLGGREIDFVAEKNGALRYYQVAYLLPDQSTVDREFGNLAEIPDDYPKSVISMDPMAEGERGGIRHLPLREFLLHGHEH